MFSVRNYADSDYPQYCNWLAVRDRTVPKKEYLPPYGIVVSNRTEDLAIGFLFDLGGGLCTIGNLASNPGAPDRSEAVDFLLDDLLETAREEGYDMVFMNSNKKRLLERLEERGFKVYEENVTQMGRAL